MDLDLDYLLNAVLALFPGFLPDPIPHPTSRLIIYRPFFFILLFSVTCVGRSVLWLPELTGCMDRCLFERYALHELPNFLAFEFVVGLKP